MLSPDALPWPLQPLCPARCLTRSSSPCSRSIPCSFFPPCLSMCCSLHLVDPSFLGLKKFLYFRNPNSPLLRSLFWHYNTVSDSFIPGAFWPHLCYSICHTNLRADSFSTPVDWRAYSVSDSIFISQSPAQCTEELFSRRCWREKTLNREQEIQYFNCWRSSRHCGGLNASVYIHLRKMIVEHFSRTSYFHSRGWWERGELRGEGESWDFLSFRGSLPWAETHWETSHITENKS